MELRLHDQPLHLLPAHAAHDAARGIVFVADLHFGKTQTFQDAGVALPEGSDADTLCRLGDLCAATNAKTLVVLGDVFHARVDGMEPVIEAIARWCKARPHLKWIIVPGNHDRRVPWLSWFPDAEVIREGDSIGPWRTAHHPEQHVESPTLCGHWHPGIAIGDARIRKKVLPCFWLRGTTLVLPSFGTFTGCGRITREPGDRVFVPVKDQVVELPAQPRHSDRRG